MTLLLSAFIVFKFTLISTFVVLCPHNSELNYLIWLNFDKISETLFV